MTGTGSTPHHPTPKVLLTDHPWPEVDVERAIVEAAGYELVVGPGEPADPAEIERLCGLHQPVGVLTCWARVSGKAIESVRDLRIVARMGVGLDNIDVAAATGRSIVVTNVPDYCIEEVSDHAIALMLASLRGIAALDREVRSGVWSPGSAKVARISALTVGLIGYGRIGRATARKLAGFGCRILVSDPHATDVDPYVQAVDLDTIRREADVIILHVPLLDSTHHMVDAAFIDGCVRRPLLVNVSRGPLVDNDALLAGLEAGKLSGAGLDVVEGEPNPPPALAAHPLVVMTPHVAFSSPQAMLELRTRSTEEVVRVLRGGAPHYPCNKVAAAGTPLTGGVASDIALVATPLGPVIVKSALATLKVAAEWKADPARSMIEVKALQAMAELLGADTVPRVLWSDPRTNSFGMEKVDRGLNNWKQSLLAGDVDLATAARVGELAGLLHSRSAARPDYAAAFSDRSHFEDLRIAPYLERIETLNGPLAPGIRTAIEALRQPDVFALVHGDLSPKNILAAGDDVVLLDAEVAHWGDPRFDIAFCLSHLVLKSLLDPAMREALLASIDALVDAYRRDGPPVLDTALSRLLGCLILARLEGDSPVDYLDRIDWIRAKQIAAKLIAYPVEPAGLVEFLNGATQ